MTRIMKGTLPITKFIETKKGFTFMKPQAIFMLKLQKKALNRDLTQCC